MNSPDRERRLTEIAQKCSGSYRRRWPGENVVAEIRELEAVYVKEPLVTQKLIGLCKLAEFRLDYDRALHCISQIKAIGEADRQMLKWEARLRTEQNFWRVICLHPEELHELGETLQSALSLTGSLDGRSLRLATEWLHSHCSNRIEQVLDGLSELGAFSDWQVLMNVVR